MTQNKHLYSLDILRAAAVVLILNSHYEGVYPIELAIGGELGLSLFFSLSGFLSSSVNSETRFVPWIIKKALRLYIPLYIWMIIRILFNTITIEIRSFIDVIRTFIYPTRAWFSSWLLVLYIVYFVFIKYIYARWKQRALVSALVVTFSAFVILYWKMEMLSSVMLTFQMPSKVLWLFCMLFGFFIHEYIFTHITVKMRYCMCGVFLSVVAYGIFKIVLYKGFAPHLKCMPTVFSVIAAPFMLVFFLTIEKYNPIKTKYISRKRLVQLCSSCSLEIYYVQETFIGRFKGMFFPANWLCITITVLLTGYILHFLAAKSIEHIKVKKQIW